MSNLRARVLRLGILVASTSVWTAGAPAQDAGAPQESRKSTVIKGVAPVAKKLLRVRFPQPKAFTLSNGARIFVLEDHRLPAIRINLSMEAGPILESKPGVAEMTASMLQEGTQSRSYQRMAEETEGIGAQLNSTAASEHGNLSVAGLSEFTDQLVGLFADTLLHPAFPEDRLERAKFRQVSQLRQRGSNATGLAAETVAKVFYGSTPYARVTPTADQVRAITRADLAAFHDRYYRPTGAIIGITGDVNAKEIVGKLEKALAEWKPAVEPVQLPETKFESKDSMKIYLVDRPNSAQTVLDFGSLAISRTDPDYIAMVVANRILGGGSSGRLFQNIREDKGYTYGAYSTLNTPKWQGMWGASASVRTPVTEPAVSEFLKEFARLRDETVPETELASAKRSIVGGFARTLESPEGILGRALELVQNELPANYWDTYPAKIEAVTAADVQRVARKYLAPNRVQLIAVGERSKIEEGLRKFGPVEVVESASRSTTSAPR